MRALHTGILLGAGGLLLLAILAAGIFAASYDIAADSPHAGLTTALIGYTREHSIAARARDIHVPNLNDPKMLREGAEHYDAMCTGCHLAPGMAENEMRPGMNPKPPILWQYTGDPARQFWIIKHGIKMTGMPAWGTTHTDEEIWNMVALLQKLPHLTPAQYRALVASSGSHHEHDMDMSH
ncbi:MAG TPA: cytochrome c [Rhizomicrobium sp.]